MHHVIYELQHQSQESQNQIIIPPGTPPNVKKNSDFTYFELYLLLRLVTSPGRCFTRQLQCHQQNRQFLRRKVATLPRWSGWRTSGDQQSSLILMFASKIRSLTKLAFYVFTFSRRNHQVKKKKNTLFRCKTTLQPSVCFRDPLYETHGQVKDINQQPGRHGRPTIPIP